MRELAILTAKYAIVVIPLLVLWVWWKTPPEQRRQLLLRGVLALALSAALAKLGGALYYDPRPFVTQHVAPLIPHEADNGFPSDHVLLALAGGFFLLPFSWPAAGVGALAGAAIGLARVACHIHSPLDIGGSAFLAALANLIAARVVRFRRPLSPDRRTP